MSFDIIKGVAPRPQLSIKRCLKLDGVNDYLTLGNSSFYNIGSGEFTFAFSLLKYTNKATSAIFRSADETGSLVSRIVVSIVSDTQLQIALVNSGENFDDFRYNLGNQILNKFCNLIIIRKGNNFSDSDDVLNYTNSIRNPINYHVYLDGIKLTPTSVTMVNPKGLYYLLDNNKPKVLGAITNNSSYFYNGYISLFGYWNRAITTTEIQNINNGILDDYQAKGIFVFDGDTSDISSVQGTMTLLNNTAPSYVSFPYKSGVIPFLKITANQVKIFTYKENVIITKIWKEQSSYNGFLYSLNNGSTWNTIPDGSLVTVSIVVPANTNLLIKDPTSRANYNVLHLDFE